MFENHVYAAIEQAQMALAKYKAHTQGIPKEGHRALSVVATKLDEARLWFGEAVSEIEAAVAESDDPR